MHDPALHLFLDDDGLLVRERLYRLSQRLRAEATEPMLAANGEDEGSGISYSSVLYDQASRQFKLWYLTHQHFDPRLAVSEDARRWVRQGLAMEAPGRGFDNLGLAAAGSRLAPWFAGARWVGYAYQNRGETTGLCAVRSHDGLHLEAMEPGLLPGAGDRTSLFYDDIADEYWLITRRGSLGLPGAPKFESRVRRANLWKSRDFVQWQDCGIILECDDEDDPDMEIYGMQPFRWGQGFLAFVEMYHARMERLDTQLAYSADGLLWRRSHDRAAVLPTGGEGAWDSHWCVPTNNPPIPRGERVLVPYVGAGTKHGSNVRHRRGIGLASIRRDGWVSLEAGRQEGWLVTRPLPLERPMTLEVNAELHSGYLSVAVYSARPGHDQTPLLGYEADASRTEHSDASQHRIAWSGRTVIPPVEGGQAVLRITLYQGSLFSYRWADAGETTETGKLA